MFAGRAPSGNGVEMPVDGIPEEEVGVAEEIESLLQQPIGGAHDFHRSARLLPAQAGEPALAEGAREESCLTAEVEGFHRRLEFAGRRRPVPIRGMALL